jgi:predicted ATPase
MMQKEAELEYAKMKDFLSFYAERYLKAEGLPPDKQPIASLEALEKSMKMAFDGLRQAINDCVEMSLHFDHAEVAKLDSELRSRGIVTLSELRRQYSKSYKKIMKRGQITNEAEYYLVRNVLYDPTEKNPEECKLLEKLVSEYEIAS